VERPRRETKKGRAGKGRKRAPRPGVPHGTPKQKGAEVLDRYHRTILKSNIYGTEDFHKRKKGVRQDRPSGARHSPVIRERPKQGTVQTTFLGSGKKWGEKENRLSRRETAIDTRGGPFRGAIRARSHQRRREKAGPNAQGTRVSAREKFRPRLVLSKVQNPRLTILLMKGRNDNIGHCEGFAILRPISDICFARESTCANLQNKGPTTGEDRGVPPLTVQKKIKKCTKAGRWAFLNTKNKGEASRVLDRSTKLGRTTERVNKLLARSTCGTPSSAQEK